MSFQDFKRVIKTAYRFSEVASPDPAPREYWFCRQVSAEIRHFVWASHLRDRGLIEFCFGVESESERRNALEIIDRMCTENGRLPITGTRWSRAPCLILFPVQEPARVVRDALDQVAFSEKVLAPLETEVFNQVRTREQLANLLLRTDGSLDWAQSAPVFRLVFAAILVKQLGLSIVPFWNVVGILRPKSLSGHAVVRQVGLSPVQFLRRFCELIELETDEAQLKGLEEG